MEAVKTNIQANLQHTNTASRWRWITAEDKLLVGRMEIKQFKQLFVSVLPSPPFCFRIFLKYVFDTMNRCILCEIIPWCFSRFHVVWFVFLGILSNRSAPLIRTIQYKMNHETFWAKRAGTAYKLWFLCTVISEKKSASTYHRGDQTSFHTVSFVLLARCKCLEIHFSNDKISVFSRKLLQLSL